MAKRITALLLAAILLLGLAACGTVESKDGITPQLRIDAGTNEWEVSYDNGASWTSLKVQATASGSNGTNGADGRDGADGKDGITPQLRISAETNEWEVSYDNGASWTSLAVKATGADGKDGLNGTDGKDGINGVNGSNGTNGTDGSNGVTPTIGEDGYWYIGDVCTNIYAGSAQKVTVTFREFAGLRVAAVAKGSRVGYYVPENCVADFVNWYADEACTELFDFNAEITVDTTVYSKWEYNETFRTVGALLANTSFGKASCFGTSACFGSVYFRVLADAHDYYDGAAGIANYLKGVFVEDDNGTVSVNPSSSLRGISYTDALTVINFSSAFSSYQEYILRNDLTMPEELAQQKELAIRYFNTVDDTAEGYHTHTGGGLTFPSMAVAVVALGSLMDQTETERFDTLIQAAYENVDDAFWNSIMYLQPFYQLCAKYDWYDLSAVTEELSALEVLTDANILKYYGYGIDLAGDYAELWNAWEDNALSDGVLSVSEAKAFAYHYAYQLTGGDVSLGIYGGSRAIVDFGTVTD